MTAAGPTEQPTAARPPAEVTIYTDEGCKRFAAAVKNGITSREWGAYAMSYAFAKPLPACPN